MLRFCRLSGQLACTPLQRASLISFSSPCYSNSIFTLSAHDYPYPDPSRMLQSLLLRCHCSHASCLPPIASAYRAAYPSWPHSSAFHFHAIPMAFSHSAHTITPIPTRRACMHHSCVDVTARMLRVFRPPPAPTVHRTPPVRIHFLCVPFIFLRILQLRTGVLASAASKLAPVSIISLTHPTQSFVRTAQHSALVPAAPMHAAGLPTSFHAIPLPFSRSPHPIPPSNNHFRPTEHLCRSVRSSEFSISCVHPVRSPHPVTSMHHASRPNPNDPATLFAMRDVTFITVDHLRHCAAAIVPPVTVRPRSVLRIMPIPLRPTSITNNAVSTGSFIAISSPPAASSFVYFI